jgi:hypothetical protein
LDIEDKSANDKYYLNQTFIVSLNFFWSLDIKSGFTFSIYKSKVQVMAKRIVMSQIANLTFDH